MACAAPDEPKKKDNSRENKSVKLFITSFTDEFFSERDLLKKKVLPELKVWCESKQLTLTEYFVKWGGRHPDRRDVSELEKVQTTIENCYYNNIIPLFINFTCDSVYWVPMWGEYPDEWIEDYLEAYGLLVEDLEVLYGAYRDDNLNSLFLVRRDSCLEAIPSKEKCCFLQKSCISERIQSQGNKISLKFPPTRIINYSCQYHGQDHRKRPKLQLQEDLAPRILEFCKWRILHDYCGEEANSYHNSDLSIKQAHLAFMQAKSKTVKGREDVIKRIENYILHEEKDVPLLLLGGSGCGKSSVLCKAADSINQKASKKEIKGPADHQWHVFYHFVGAVPGSTDLESAIKRLLREMEIVNDSNLPKTTEAAAQLCCSMLANPNTKPVIIFIDALNQFAEEHAARVMSWLPRKLAPQVRCVFTMINDTPLHITLMSRETKPIECHIDPLDVQSRKDIVKDTLNQYSKSLTEANIVQLVSKPSSDNPLWLTVACEEIRHQERIETAIDELPVGLLNLLEKLLSRLETESGGNLIVATLCLLEASSAGLLESELRLLLRDEASLMPPSPFDEKEEKESLEKEKSGRREPLSDSKWNIIFHTLRPFLRPYGDSREGRLDFYHRALSKAVRWKYFLSPVVENSEEKPDAFYWWHKMLADFFEHVENVDRFIEEYPYQIVCLNDKYRLAKCLCDWRVFDKLYNEEYSSQLLAYWRKVGPTSDMISNYESALSKFEEDENVNEEAVSIRYEKVCRVVIQSGKYHEALELLKTAMKIEEKELGARPHRMVELFALMAEIYDEKLKLNDFVSPSQVPDLRKTIHYGRKSIALRRTLPGSYHKFKLAMSLMKLAFNMESWEACGGGQELSGEEALIAGNKYIDKALKIFQELNDMGHYAEALMTKGVLARRGSMEQLKLYNQAMDLCMQMYGEYHILTSRLYINIGIVYEDNEDFKKAYEYFKKWARVSEEILGPDHPKTLRAKGVLREVRYRRIARDLGEDEGNDDDDNDEDDDDEETENRDYGNYYDDGNVVGQDFSDNNQALQISIDSNVNSLVGLVNEETEHRDLISLDNQHRSEDANEEVENDEALMNGYFDEEQQIHDDNGEHENSDSENFYDDNFEDYDEHYILHLDNGQVIDDFNIQLYDDDEDFEIVQIAESDYINIDNRYAADSHDSESDNELHNRN